MSENAGDRSLPFNYLYDCYTSRKLRRRMKCASLCSTAFVRNIIRTYSRAVRKVSVHSEYLENRSRGLDLTWQPVRGDLTVHPWTVTLPWGSSVGSETPLIELVYCVTVAFTNRRYLSLGKPKVAGSQIWAVGGLTDLDDVMLPPPPKKSLHESCRIGRRIVWSARSVIVNATVTQYTVHKFSQRRLTAEWLAPRESDCSRMHSKVSSDWLPR